jgi:flagellin
MKINSSDSLSRNLGQAQAKQNKSLEKLSSGKRINKASDDPAGLQIADQLKSAIDSLGQASRNISDVGSVSEITDGALEQVGNISSRLKELATQSSNGTLSDEQRGALQQEYSSLTQEVQRISQTTQFNGKNLLDGSDTTAQAGIESDSNSQITLKGVDVGGTVSNVASQDISTQQGAQNALTSVDSFITAVSSARGELGGSSARLEFAHNNVAVEKENAAAAESRIRDVDVAEEAANLVKNKILTQVNTALSAQSKLDSQQVLKLLS